MRPPDNEPWQDEIERLVTGEEQDVLDKKTVPDDVKAEIAERIERFHEADLDQERAEDARNEP